MLFVRWHSASTPGLPFHPRLQNMAKHFVKIANRGSYTNHERALHYVMRRLAVVSLACAATQRILEIRMLEESELAVERQRLRVVAEDLTVAGSFAWHVGDSGGSRIMKDGTARGTRPGQSGGYRVLKASHGIPN